MVKLNRGGRRLCLLPWEDLLLPFGVGGGDPSAAGKDTAIQWPSRKTVHQLGERSAASPPPSPRSMPSSIHHTTAPSHD
jgi:hypothetical protein